MKGYDAFAGVIKSGGKTRRAAKMVILNADHPDILDFINCKVEEEKKAWALIDAGYDGSFTGQAYSSVFLQNSNNSVRVTDEFMRAVLDDGVWETRAVMPPHAVMDTYKARDLMRLIADGAHVYGDREEQPRLPAARPGLREPRGAPDVARPAVRQRRGPRLRGGAHRADDGRGLRAVGAHRARPRRAVRRV